jgi:hypothetical protein
MKKYLHVFFNTILLLALSSCTFIPNQQSQGNLILPTESITLPAITAQPNQPSLAPILPSAIPATVIPTTNPSINIAYKIADYLVSQQNADGAIPDVPGSDTVNEDSNMEYALLGIASAYYSSHDPRYLTALEKGIQWLAAREEMTDATWRGSWFYSYQSASPYAAIPANLDENVMDVRGVDATNSLFVYLLYLDSILSGSNTLVEKYSGNARAALDFLLTNDRSQEGYFFNSWQLSQGEENWRLYRYRYTADQGDVYLGLQAGWILFQDSRYQQAASFIQDSITKDFFDSSAGTYIVGIEEDGTIDQGTDGFESIFPQGYLPWIFGDNSANQSSYGWLNKCVQADGSLSCYEDDPHYSLSAIINGMAASSLGKPVPEVSAKWITTIAFDASSGGVKDSTAEDTDNYSNVAGLAIVDLLQFHPNLK